MRKQFYFLLACLIFLTAGTFAQDDYLKIDASVSPNRIRQGEEGILKIKIIPRSDVKISSQLLFMIKFHDNSNLSFPKIFFTAPELDLQTKQENDSVYLDFEKEIPITFKVNETSLIGKHKISGEVVYTAVFKDRWSLKTFQVFNVDFNSTRKRTIRKR